MSLNICSYLLYLRKMEEELPLSSSISFSWFSSSFYSPHLASVTHVGMWVPKVGKFVPKVVMCINTKNGDWTLTELQAIRKISFDYTFLTALAKTCLGSVLKDSDMFALSVLKYFSAKLDFPFKAFLCVT